jgi:hypothetical protein
MLLIDGTLSNGETYNSQVVNPMDLINLFNIPKLKGQAVADIRLATKYTHKDQFGQTRKLLSLRLNPVFTVQDEKGNSFTLRYFKSRNKNGKNGETFSPTRMVDAVGGAALITAAEQDKYVYYWLNPDNKTSPFNKGKRFKYFFYDAEAEAMATLHVAAFRRSISNEIQDAHIDVIRAKALSLKIQTNSGMVSVDNATSVGEAPLRANLLNLLDRYPREFVNAWATSGDNLVGKLRLAIDRKIIVEKKDPNSSNMPAWFWNTDQNKERITVITGLKGALMALHNAFADNYNGLYPILEDAMAWSNIENGRNQIVNKVTNADSTKTDIMKAAWDISAHELVGEALSREVIYFDRSSGVLYELKDGEIGDQLFSTNNPKAWRDEYAEYLEEQPIPVINTLRLKLGHQVLRDRKAEAPVSIEIEDGPAKKPMGRPKQKK